MSTTDDDSNRATEPNLGPAQPDLPGCGPGGRGFESRRSPLTNSLQSGTIGRSQEAALGGPGSNSGSNLGSEQGSSEGSEDPPPRPRLRGDETELDTSSEPRAPAIHGCASGGSADRAPASAWSSSQASVCRRSETPARRAMRGCADEELPETSSVSATVSWPFCDRFAATAAPVAFGRSWLSSVGPRSEPVA